MHLSLELVIKQTDPVLSNVEITNIPTVKINVINVIHHVLLVPHNNNVLHAIPIVFYLLN